MSPEKQIKIIRKFHGWKRGGRYSETATFNGWIPPGGKYMVQELPNYIKNFNALHDVEMKLTGDQKKRMIEILCEIVNRDDKTSSGITTAFFATPKQRTEALAKTIHETGN